jgi:hypothetical protein
MPHDSTDRVCLVGPLPPPYGGVSEHIYRLASATPQFISEIIDLYSTTEHKLRPENSAVSVSVAPRSSWFRPVWFLLQLGRSNCSVFHFHFSLPRALLLLTLARKRRVKTWILTLHNGDLGIGAYYGNFLLKKLMHAQVMRFDRIVCLSSAQEQFFLQIGVPKSRLIRLPSYLPPPRRSDSPLVPSFDELRQRNAVVVLTSGYPERFYNFDQLVYYADSHKLVHGAGVGFAIAVYGNGDWNWINTLKVIASQRGLEVIFLENLDRDAFASVIQNTDIYVRPTLMDSYGIALADAINCGAIAIASDICERYEGCRIFPTGDVKAFFKQLDYSISEVQLNAGHKRERVNHPASGGEIVGYSKLYSDANIRAH